MLWAWERPDDLRSLDPRIGVAFLAGTIFLRPPQPEQSTAPEWLVRPRLQPLRIQPDAYLMAVVRIETSGTIANTPQATQGVAGAIIHLASWPGVKSIQIDFDATQSQRDFYRSLLIALRRQLSPNLPLSITALASWCQDDLWLSSLPPGTIDEAVPMLFRMGPGASNIASAFKQDRDFRLPACRASLGLSTDEPFSRALLTAHFSEDSSFRTNRRIYVFHPAAWTPQSIQAATAEIQPWHDAYSRSH